MPVRSERSRGFTDWLVMSAAPPLAPLTSGESGRNPAALSTALAELFNAHGFFTAEPESGVGKWLGQLPERQCSNPQATSLTGNTCREPMAGEPRGRERAADPIHPFAAREAPPLASPGAGQRSDRAAPLSVARAHAAPNAAIIRGIREPVGADGAGPEPALGNSQLRHPSGRPSNHSSDRILFRIGDAAVDLFGRLEGLSEDEEERLFADLSALLAEHGLGLGSATINGTMLARGRLRERG